MPIYRRIDEVDKVFLQSLVDEEVMEDRGLEYKRDLNIQKDPTTIDLKAEKRKFCAEISAFANADGGYLIFGVADEKGMPQKDGICGIDKPDDFDQLKLKIHGIIDKGIEPQLFGVDMAQVKLDVEKIALLIHIPSSWSKPHWVGEKGCRTFYTRTSGGKDHLDIRNVRELFVLSETAAERIRTFRGNRAKGILEGDVPVFQGHKPILALHLVPFSAESSQQNVDFRALQGEVFDVGNKTGFNLSGMYAGIDEHFFYHLYRNGCIEYVKGNLATFQNKYIDSTLFESNILFVLPRMMKWLKQLKVSPPFYVMLTLLGGNGRSFHLSNLQSNRLEKEFGHYVFEDDRRFNLETLIIPEEMMYSYDSDLQADMRPVFDMVWQAAGLPCSLNYDENGKWDGGQPKGQA